MAADHVGRELAEALLEGCYVRLRHNPESGYILRQICATRLPPPPGVASAAASAPAAAPVWPLVIETELVDPGEPPLSVSSVKASDADPFHDPAAYDAGGRKELQRLREELAMFGRPPGMPLQEAAAAAWRRHVALTWVGQNLLGRLDIR